MLQDYKGWKYDLDVSGRKYVVIPNQKVELPGSFYKYYSLSDNSVDALLNLFVYASHPALLNDPFDCDVSLVKIEDEHNARYLLGDSYEDIRKMYSDNDRFYKYISEYFTTSQFAKIGIFSMTDSYNNPLMWTHYTENTGFCLEWDISKFPFPYFGPTPIHYVDKVEHVSSIEYELPNMLVIQSNVKYDYWEYEHEWRLLINSPEGFDMKTFGKYSNDINKAFPDLHDRKFRYPLSALKSITIGVNFLRELKEQDRINVVSSTEISACYKNQCHQTRILDFLDRLCQCSDIIIRFLFKDDLMYKEWIVDVVKNDYLTYRIIEKQ